LIICCNDSAFRHGYWRCATLSAWGKVQKLESPWSDKVHLTIAGYKLLAEAILEAKVDLMKKRSGDKLE
jgi:lysophospholipase L1-like esterase